MKWISKAILWVTGWKLEYDSSYKNFKRQIVIFPHTSGWEMVIAVLMSYAYGENFDIAVWNGQFAGFKKYILRHLGCIPIENRKSVGNVAILSEYLKKKDRFKFCISPEGSRYYVDKFRSGFYYIAKNTKAMYNVVTINFENHTMTSYILKPSDSYEDDCQRVADLFSTSVHLYPDCVFYGCAPHMSRSIVNWKRVSLCAAGYFIMCGIIGSYYTM